MRFITILLLLSMVVTTQGFSVSSRTLSQIIKQQSTRISSPQSLPTLLKLSPIDEDEVENVNVNLVDDIDSFTLTAVGFALIAFNFFVFANMGDAGIGGIVARIINALT